MDQGRVSEREVEKEHRNEYKAFDTVHADGTKCLGRGEVCIRGGSVSSGYLFQPDKTAEAFQADGWFRSGDVGIFLTDGSLKLVDRMRCLGVQLSFGVEILFRWL